jgi:pyruvate ferredoxin oxidoreductase delta subunit
MNPKEDHLAKSEEGLGWKDLEIGCVISKPGNARQYKTGDWRSLKPVCDTGKCIRCGICYIFCPDMAIQKTEAGYFEADLYYCKGCGICAQECFTGCIRMVAEEE